MKKYETPEYEVEKFLIKYILTLSDDSLDNGTDTDYGEEFPF